MQISKSKRVKKVVCRTPTRKVLVVPYLCMRSPKYVRQGALAGFQRGSVYETHAVLKALKPAQSFSDSCNTTTTTMMQYLRPRGLKHNIFVPGKFGTALFTVFAHRILRIYYFLKSDTYPFLGFKCELLRPLHRRQ